MWSLKLATVRVFAPQEPANITNQGLVIVFCLLFAVQTKQSRENFRNGD